MRKAILIILIFLSASPARAFDQPYGGIKLLEGYKFKRSHTFDTINGVIYKDDGLTIEFEAGVNEGFAVDPKDKNKYVWYREQVINGHKVMLALTKPGAATAWKPENPRTSKTVNILIVTFPGRFGPMSAANFYAEVLNEEEIADMLLMVLTFDPDK